MPETGMGYQVVEAIKSGSYIREKYLVLNSEIVIQLNDYVDGYVSKIRNNPTDFRAEFETLSTHFSRYKH